MATYAIGDLQGCYVPFKNLLDQVDFNPSQDHLYLVGDLVARGPDSLSCMDLVYQLKDSVTVTLGNHDLHLLATALTHKQPNPKDKLAPLFASDKLESYVAYLQSQPLCFYDPQFDSFISHAGIYPQWDINTALRLSDWAQKCYQGSMAASYLNAMYGKQSSVVVETDDKQVKFNSIINVFSRMRFLTRDLCLDFDNKGGLEHANELQPWFSHPRFKTTSTQFIFGHWAALEGKTTSDKVVALDTGCVWGGPMTLLNLSTNEQISSK
ncbi:bis(5'-nucleosyl)-tetraphosphatase (symmetrical) [Pseudoalteromonas luteoviolacea]|uniref:bis(5'-nucleosyl)-tetraphosphatase (symmetrical) n=1 Tax=Pseudoalteromonas luteoviolacea TaxID=43657 RepID=A0A1C0TNC6_9GAMM|nr:symmetrical bis(5'-nucleosyl)-tetraphosphatase [Pseudoalteromonas luteoviolacea]MBQ4813036.1 symmetrical bis(5'-nucleosyl)-tetraphosphatase [Pseudoalteromonas luteoviolacea]OCQ20439.1 bis(5'-nucleosyl)-tetraphosphatase (symmetrical) [Pseudoalteromonas luteoviolacea]